MHQDLVRYILFQKKKNQYYVKVHTPSIRKKTHSQNLSKTKFQNFSIMQSVFKYLTVIYNILIRH